MTLDKETAVGIIGAGTMGAGIAQIASTNGHEVYLYDAYAEQLPKAKSGLEKILNRQVEKGECHKKKWMEFFPESILWKTSQNLESVAL